MITVIQSNTFFPLILLDDAATLDYSISMERDSDTSIYCFGATCCYLTGSSLAISILLYIITRRDNLLIELVPASMYVSKVRLKL